MNTSENNKCSINISYTPGPIKVTKASAQLAPFTNELKLLRLPRDVNNPIYYLNSTFSAEEVKEILRRFSAVYHTWAEARFNLAIAQLKNYPLFLSEDSDTESHLWITTVFLNSSIIAYQSLFDLILQVSWVYYKLYSNFQVSKSDPTKLSVTTENIDIIMRKCKWESILKYKSILDSQYWNLLSTFKDTETYNRVNELANSLKHRYNINYEEIAIDEQLLVQGQNYNSADTLSYENIDKVIKELKDYHKEIYAIIKSMVETHTLT